MTSKFFLISFFTFIFILFLHPLEGDGDFYHHLNTGKYVLENLSLPKFDEWTFTAQGQPWIAHSWAAGILFYLIYKFFGVAGITIFVALIGLLTFILIYTLFKSYQLKDTFIYPLLLLLASLFLIRFPSRPEIFTYPLLISILLIDKLATRSSRLFLLYPPIIFFWSILYGANVFLGLGLLFLLLIKRLKQHNNMLIFSVLLSFLLSSLNGNGLDSIFYIFKIANIAQFQGEWLGIVSILKVAPVDYLYFFKFRLLIYSIFLLLYLYLFLTHIKAVRNHWWEFFISLAVFLPVFTFRQIPLAVSLSLPLLSIALTSQPKRLYSKLISGLWFLSTISLLITLFYNSPRLELIEDPAKIRLASFISEGNLSGNAYTNQQIGSFLSFKFYPKILISYDTRDDLFIGGKFLIDYLSPAPLELILNRYHADLVVLDTNEGLEKAKYLQNSPNWIQIYFEDNFLVMKRK